MSTTHERVREWGTTLADLERNVLAALASGPLPARELARRAGYVYNSRFRAVLAGLCWRGLVARHRPPWDAATPAGMLRPLYRLAETEGGAP